MTTFVDHVVLHVTSGNGGNGCASVHREKFKPLGGPDGGNGGNGGDVILVVDPNVTTLLDYHHAPHRKATSGKPGQGNHRNGAMGGDLVLPVPDGTIVKSADGEVLIDLLGAGATYVVAAGGRGGLGNAALAGPRRKAPGFALLGEPGWAGDVLLELKTVADIGLVGYPSAGKSSLVAAISAARPKIADYPFTTLAPNLGVVQAGDVRFTVADVPGLIPGASEGKGLGLEFLRHIERCAALVHVLDCATLEPGRDPVTDLDVIEAELAQYGGLADRPRLVALNKIDVPEAQELADLVTPILEERGYSVHQVSAASHAGLRELTFAMARCRGRGPRGRPAAGGHPDRPASQGGRRRGLRGHPRGRALPRPRRAPRALDAADRLRQRRGRRLPRRPARQARHRGQARRAGRHRRGRGGHRRRGRLGLRLGADDRGRRGQPARPARHRPPAGRPRVSPARPAVAAARRVVVKVGSSSIASFADGIDQRAVQALVDVLAAHRAAGHEVVLVSSGAIATGLAPLGLSARPRDLATQQAAASVGQGVLVHRYTEAFAQHGITVGQVLLTADDVIRRAHYRNAQRTLYRLLELGILPVVNENDTVATDEIRLGDNDRLAALVAHLLHADLLVLLSDVDGLYDGDPSRGDARLLTQVSGDADLTAVTLGRPGRAGVGVGGMVTKVEAARIATGAGMHVVLTSTAQAAAALAGEEVGTVFTPTAARIPTRLLWLAHAATPARAAQPRRRRRTRGRRSPALAAAGRHHRGRRRVRGG